MGEPATEMDLMDSAKALRGLDIGLKKAMASDLDELSLEVKTIVIQKPVVDPQSARFYRNSLK